MPDENLSVQECKTPSANESERIKERWVRAAQLPKIFCSWDLAYRCTSAGWLKPVVQGKRRTIYRLADALACMKRIEAGELPPKRVKKAKQSSF